ncbi:restriction endonuclease subunit S [Methylophaga thalassica]|uniref:restriction endonuclease subunit S n=1 Tax=Methylophaga thalassica TaxID=40223 RepID=UPI002E7BB639|nr:restriction endonuclease subunit S [Methylophaga thalassica]WVI84148.1 restriction endonuclease subunit S [Methylophaga thalassica]
MPKNWNIEKIPELLFFQEGPGVRKWQFKDSGVKLLNVGNINKGKIDLSSTKIFLSEEEAYGKYSHFMVDSGDLLIACSGILLENFHNKISFVDDENLPLCLNTSTMRFRSLDDDILDLRYFKYFLQTEHFNKQLRRLITGSAQLNFGPSHIKKIDIILPPLAEQKQIAAILDTADSLRQKDQQLVEHYTALSQSLFLEMFGDFIENPKGFDQCFLGDVLCEKNSIKCGPFGSQLKIGEFVEAGIPVYGIDNVQINRFVNAKPKYITEEKFNELSAFHVSKNDLLISRTGTVGRACLAPEIDKAVIGPNLLKVRIQNSRFNPVFLAFAFNYSNSIINQIKMFSPGATVAVYNTGNLRKLNVLTPPIKLQNQFAEYIAFIEKQKQQAQMNLEKSEMLFNSLLQRAFTGELTANKAA